jgi:hypothetical protein
MSEKINIANAVISEETIEQQIQNLKNGPKELNLIRPCTIGDGIISLSQSEKEHLIASYESLISDKSINRFTPASGAATRMFKHLFEGDNTSNLLSEFIKEIKKFAFYENSGILDEDSSHEMIEKVLGSEGLNYAQLPKALIDFHKYSGEVRKSIDDQLIEGIAYIKSNQKANFHFTVSEEHKKVVQEHLDVVLVNYSSLFNTEFNISFSTQLKSTDTIALDETNALVYDEQGQLLFRPGGHGSLIHNLNQIDADVIFVKNIDNIVREEKQKEVIRYKKVLGAHLLNLQSKIFGILKELNGENMSEFRLTEVVSFIQNELNLKVELDKEKVFDVLNRPIRVCGMVKNEGKAGGGPFWVDDSVQIVESAQMNLKKAEVSRMLENATHFNPVDLVCGVKNYKDQKFDLIKYIDKETFFVTSKSYHGREIKVLEHPGLWNGAMANWITVFVEVPVSTFHPVKTVNDLLGDAHQV